MSEEPKPASIPASDDDATGATAPAEGGYSVKLPDFEGPLDLLLHLIQQHELDIMNIPIGFITEKYLLYLKLMEKLNIDVASEYLVMAASLAHIKSKMLLPTVPEDQEEEPENDEDPRTELVRRLLEYQKYKDAAEQLASRPVLGRDVFLRGAPAPSIEGPAPLAPLSLFKLLDAFQSVLDRTKTTIDHEINFDRFSISDRINSLTDLLRNKPRVAFEELFEGHQTRADLVVTFLALLEMTRLRLTRLYQDGPLDPILIELTDVEAEAEAVPGEVATMLDNAASEGQAAAIEGQEAEWQSTLAEGQEAEWQSTLAEGQEAEWETAADDEMSEEQSTEERPAAEAEVWPESGADPAASGVESGTRDGSAAMAQDRAADETEALASEVAAEQSMMDGFDADTDGTALAEPMADVAEQAQAVAERAETVVEHAETVAEEQPESTGGDPELLEDQDPAWSSRATTASLECSPSSEQGGQDVQGDESVSSDPNEPQDAAGEASSEQVPVNQGASEAEQPKSLESGIPAEDDSKELSAGALDGEETDRD